MISIGLKTYLVIEKLMIEAEQQGEKNLAGELRDFSIISWSLLTEFERNLMKIRQGSTANQINTVQFIIPEYELEITK